MSNLIVFVQGDNWRLPIEWRDANDTAVNLTSKTFTATMAWSSGESITFADGTGLSVLSAGSGRLLLSMDFDDARQATPPTQKRGFLTVTCTHPTGEVQTLVSVPVQVQKKPKAALSTSGSNPEVVQSTVKDQELRALVDSVVVSATFGALLIGDAVLMIGEMQVFV